MKVSKLQIVQLKIICDNLRHLGLKKLLNRAIPVWKKEGVVFDEHGVKLRAGKIIRDRKVNGVDLVGGAILGCKTSVKPGLGWFDDTKSVCYYKPAWTVSGISGIEFDRINSIFEYEQESVFYDFNSVFDEEILKIVKILKGDLEREFEDRRLTTWNLNFKPSQLQTSIVPGVPDIKSANEELSDWILVDDYCWTRIVKGGDSNNIKDRRCFIEKTGRVFDSSFKLPIENHKSWVSCYRGDYSDKSGETREMCDLFALHLGYKLP